MSASTVTGLVWISIMVAGVAGYASWAWWIGPAIGASAGLLNLAPAFEARVGILGLLMGAVFNVGLFSALPYGAYALTNWLFG
jgi:hypothetical protein